MLLARCCAPLCLTHASMGILRHLSIHTEARKAARHRSQAHTMINPSFQAKVHAKGSAMMPHCSWDVAQSCGQSMNGACSPATCRSVLLRCARRLRGESVVALWPTGTAIDARMTNNTWPQCFKRCVQLSQVVLLCCCAVTRYVVWVCCQWCAVLWCIVVLCLWGG